VHIVDLYISPGHNYVGHHGKPAGENPIKEVSEIDCVAGRGIRDDRFFDCEPDFKQITFFAIETFDALREEFGLADKTPASVRRNVITRGAELNDLIGQHFEVQGVRFEGVEESRPCYWMDQALCDGAEEALRGRGGLRARILSSGKLKVDAPA
jgi:hypothetical protein